MNNQEKLREIERDIVSALIVSSDGLILMGRKDPSKGGVYADAWHIPGGGVDEGETKNTTLIREVREETALDITSSKIELIDDQGKGTSIKTLKDTGEQVLCHMNFNVYRVEIPQKAAEVRLQPTDDLVELKWFNPADLRHVKLTPPSIELFSRLGYL